MENNILDNLETSLKDLAPLEKKGLDTSSLKIFIKNYKQFLKINNKYKTDIEDVSFDDGLMIVKSFLEDKGAFTYTRDIISFANERLGLDFKDQKESRQITIDRILNRIRRNPELKNKLKIAVMSIRNETVHGINKSTVTKKQIITADTFSKWAEIIKNI